MRSSPTGPFPSELSRRAMIGALLGLFGIACHRERGPDTSVPTDRVARDFRRLRRRIRKQVGDPERRDAALELVAAAQLQFAEVGQLLIDWREALVMLPEDRDRDDLLAVSRSYSEALGDIARKIGRLAVALRDHLTAHEWSGVFPEPEPAC